MTITAIRLLICLYAIVYNVPQSVALEVARLESDYDVAAIGDNGAAVGLFQIHSDPETGRGSWEIVRAAMGESTDDLRHDPHENVRTAMYAMGRMGLGRWWSTWESAKANTTPARESIVGARLRRIEYRNEGMVR